MARGDTYTQQYSNFIGADMSSDPREVSRNRLAYSVNMWRDYESEQGAAVETFPGFRKVSYFADKINGIYGYRDKRNNDYVVVHTGTLLYAFPCEYLQQGRALINQSPYLLENVTLANSDSTGFVFNNKLYIQDGTNYVAVSGAEEGNAAGISAVYVDAYVPTTYYDGKPYEQRNMLVDEAYAIWSETKYITESKNANDKPIKVSAGWFFFVDSEKKEGINVLKGFHEGRGMSSLNVDTDVPVKIETQAFENCNEIAHIDIRCKTSIEFCDSCFKGCENLKNVIIYLDHDYTIDNDTVKFSNSAFENCQNLTEVEIISPWGFDPEGSVGLIIEGDLPTGVTLVKTTVVDINDEKYDRRPKSTFDVKVECAEAAKKITEAINTQTSEEITVAFISKRHKELENEMFVNYVYFMKDELQYNEDDIQYDDEIPLSNAKVKEQLSPLHFSTIENVSNFYEGNTDYRKTGVEAIKGCTKSAVYDGRIFLTGNPELPNTIFFTQRNITGANDPTYFGAYNYMNDGDGNTPNVDLLSTPSMLMVLKNSTVQDGSVYYHVATDNTSEDQTARNLLPRIYPSTSGVAGLGCAGKTVPGSVACNFLDDPVFLSTRGLEAVGKQTVNLERTVTHRSGNVDRLLIKEDLSGASLAEWKGYLVICCNGHVYLADSRVVTQHEDGSYQYEWYYLEGVGCWESKLPRYRYLTYWANDSDGVNIGNYTKGEKTARETLKIRDERYVRHNGDLEAGASVTADGGWEYGGTSKTLYYDSEGYLVEQVDGELFGAGTFYGAKKVFASGDLLFFGTDGGELLLVNTDKRGVPDYEGQLLERDKISRQWYTFDDVAYESLCSLRLDDCGKKALAKNTVSGTTVARFKMMPGASCQVMVSLNGRDWNPLGRAVASRYDANDFDFETFAFAENEDEVAVLPELTRNWVMKQYLFKSGGFKRPFGLYELSYLYYAKGKIRR